MLSAYFPMVGHLFVQGLWENKYLADKSTIPALGQILKSISHQQFDGDKI